MSPCLVTHLSERYPHSTKWPGLRHPWSGCRLESPAHHGVACFMRAICGPNPSPGHWHAHEPSRRPCQLRLVTCSHLHGHGADLRDYSTACLASALTATGQQHRKAWQRGDFVGAEGREGGGAAAAAGDATSADAADSQIDILAHGKHGGQGGVRWGKAASCRHHPAALVE